LTGLSFFQAWEIDSNASAGGLTFTGDYLPSSSFVTITAVPEPGRPALAAAAVGLAAIAARRHSWWQGMMKT